MIMQAGNRNEFGSGKKTNISNKQGIGKTTAQARIRIDSAICQLMVGLPSITLANFTGWFLESRSKVTQDSQSVKMCDRLFCKTFGIIKSPRAAVILSKHQRQF